MTKLSGPKRPMGTVHVEKGGFRGGLPRVADLSEHPALHDPLRMLDGAKVTTREEWLHWRRPELRTLFQHYMYGYTPTPRPVSATVERMRTDYFGGAATKREVTLVVGPPGAPVINLLLLTPNGQGPAPAIVGANWSGNFALIKATDDTSIPAPTAWMYPGRPGLKDGRGWERDYWCPRQLIARGYALATFYNGDISPDSKDDMINGGIQRHFFKPGQTDREPHDWGCLAAWAWGLSRVVDYLLTLPTVVNGKQLCAFGHSRNGKAALLAAAMDERFAVALPHQSGTFGCALSRSDTARPTFAEIQKDYPYWFAPAFLKVTSPNLLPFDQHLLMCLVAPRPILDTEAQNDWNADPGHAWAALQAADGLYKFLGATGLVNGGRAVGADPTDGAMFGDLLNYTRPADEHALDELYWEKILQYTDRCFSRPKP